MILLGMVCRGKGYSAWFGRVRSLHLLAGVKKKRRIQTLPVGGRLSECACNCGSPGRLSARALCQMSVSSSLRDGQSSRLYTRDVTTSVKNKVVEKSLGRHVVLYHPCARVIFCYVSVYCILFSLHLFLTPVYCHGSQCCVTMMSHWVDHVQACSIASRSLARWSAACCDVCMSASGASSYRTLDIDHNTCQNRGIP